MVIKVQIPIFKQPIRYVIEPTKAEINRLKLQMDYKDHSDALTDGNGVILFFIPINKITRGIVAHETLHAVHYLGKYLGFKYSEDSEEFYAYVLEYCVEEFYKKFDKIKKKK